MRERMAEEGYLLLRGVLSTDSVAQVRSALVDVLCNAGVAVRPESAEESFGALLAARPGLVVDVHSEAGLFRRLYATESLHRLAHCGPVLEVAGSLIGRGKTILVHPRPALRVVLPGTDEHSGATPPHQDHLGMQGTVDTFTVWMPLGNCSRSVGVLSVASGSHKGGERSYMSLAGSRVAGCDVSDLDERWVCADLAPGDIVVFHSLTVHQALANKSSEIRLSVDARYQAAEEAVCAASLGDPPHMTWDEVYDTWTGGGHDLQRYWKTLATNVVPFDAGRLTEAGSAVLDGEAGQAADPSTTY
jgi:ectoine hydroxylase-related dioxygenase (phytanoyl-CoA dioxygenase family)